VLLALAGAAILLLAARALAQVYVEYEWFEAAGAVDVWRARAGATVAMRLLSGVAAGLFVFANLYAVRYSVVSLVLPRRVANLEIGEQVPSRYLMVAVVVISMLMGGVLSLPQDDWTTFAAARSNVPFGEPDPYFNSDLGFFVYWLPFERELYFWTLIGVLITTALVLFLYALTPSLRWDRGRLYVSGYVRRHLTVLAGVVLLVIAWSFRLDMYALLINGSGPDGAFGYVDHKVLIPGNLILAIATTGAALIVVWAGWTNQGRLAGSAILGVIALTLITREVAPFIGERVADEADAALRERPYQATRAGYTRRAFAADAVRHVDGAAGFASLADAAPDVAIWDAPAIARALESSRRAEVDSSFGWRGSPLGIVADAPERPLHPGNDTMRVTFGLSRVLASSSDEQGGLVRIPRAAAREDDAQLVPAVVFPGARGYLVVADSFERMGGASIESDMSRLAHALSFQRLHWASREIPRPHPKVVTHRDVRDRIRTLLPFFAQGTVVTPLVVGDSLVWVLDLYSASSSYPLSRHASIAGDDRTYFQHAATAVVQAATGEMVIVRDSAPGPIAMTWVKRFPTLFSTSSTLPASVRSALPPAIDALRAQAVAFGQYGSRTESGDPRHPPLPGLDGSDSALAGADPRFVMPATRAIANGSVLLDDSDRVRGLIVATGSGERQTLWFELPRPGPKWTTVIDRLHGGDSSTAATGTRDAAVVRGPVRAIPVGGDLAFIQPTYLWRSQGAPMLSRVGVLIRDSVLFAPTLSLVAGSPAPHAPAATTEASADLRARAAALHAAMRDALRRGDWVAFGQAFDALGKLLAPPPGSR
jgi:uncharacterized membrane protein (UPF0182 family)